MTAPADDLWVFGYGSLIWRPGFPFAEATPARLVGFQRTFCIYSTHHRGSQDRPGLVLGLDRGGSCFGLAFRVPASERASTIAYLRAREQIDGVYHERSLPVWLPEHGTHVHALTYVVERAHPAYAGRLPFRHQVQLIRAARGLSGANVAYLANTACRLADLGLRDPYLDRLVCAVGGLCSQPTQHPAGDARAMTLVGASRHHPRYAPRMRRHERRRFLHRLQLGATGAGGR